MSKLLFKIGQTLQGYEGSYKICAKLHPTVWLAKRTSQTVREDSLTQWSGAAAAGELVVMKGRSYRDSKITCCKPIKDEENIYCELEDDRRKCCKPIMQERTFYRDFPRRTSYIRPMVDEIKCKSKGAIIVLKHLDHTLLGASIQKKLNREEIKYVSRKLLKALKVIHEEGYIHAGGKFTTTRPQITKRDRCPTKQCFRQLQKELCGRG